VSGLGTVAEDGLLSFSYQIRENGIKIGFQVPGPESLREMRAEKPSFSESGLGTLRSLGSFPFLSFSP